MGRGSKGRRVGLEGGGLRGALRGRGGGPNQPYSERLANGRRSSTCHLNNRKNSYIKMKCYSEINVTKTERSPKNTLKKEMSIKLKCHSD